MNYALHKFHVKQQYVSYRVVGKSMKTLRMLSVVKVTNYDGNHRWAVIFLASTKNERQQQKICARLKCMTNWLICIFK